MERLSDQDLLVQARTDAAAFGVFYRRHVSGVHGYFRRRVPAADLAFDLTAETFAAALSAVPRYEPRPEPARAWLYAVAHNVLSEALRRGRVQDRARQALELEPIELDDDALAWLEDEAAASPALEALARLPDDQRDAVTARHIDELPYDEIAQRLACSESVVRQRVSRGLRTLATRMKESR